MAFGKHILEHLLFYRIVCWMASDSEFVRHSEASPSPQSVQSISDGIADGLSITSLETIFLVSVRYLKFQF